jgi:DNA repair exonuclease SbcCD ATPase subunit
VFAFDAHLMQERRRDHKSFFCPMGHSLYFGGESDVETLKKQLKRERQAADQLRAEVTYERDQREATERSLRGTRAALTRTKNRIAAGVCPCCSRSFQNLSEHMANKHPAYAEEPTP